MASTSKNVHSARTEVDFSGEATHPLFFSLVPYFSLPPSLPPPLIPMPRPGVYFDFLLGTLGHLKRNR